MQDLTPGTPSFSPGTTNSAADCRPRMSPPAASAASSASSRRSASGSRPVGSNAAAIASGTPSRAIMFAWHEKPSPATWPKCGMQPSPVWTAPRPAASTTATCRMCALSSTASRSRSAASGAAPPPSASSSRGPYAGSATDCVATAPTPARAQLTTEPTENQCDCTATPSSPDAGSRATIEYVPNRIAPRAYPPSGAEP